MWTRWQKITNYWLRGHFFCFNLIIFVRLDSLKLSGIQCWIELTIPLVITNLQTFVGYNQTNTSSLRLSTPKAMHVNHSYYADQINQNVSICPTLYLPCTYLYQFIICIPKILPYPVFVFNIISTIHNFMPICDRSILKQKQTYYEPRKYSITITIQTIKLSIIPNLKYNAMIMNSSMITQTNRLLSFNA